MSRAKSVSTGHKSLADQLRQLKTTLGRYRVIWFVLFVALVYGYLVLQISSLSQQEPSKDSVDSQVTRVTPHIDKNVAHQLENLRDNSVNVKTLFQDARNNPFSE